jgi:predicted methyltransferase MtxX (methanogen marker protein 4)
VQQEQLELQVVQVEVVDLDLHLLDQVHRVKVNRAVRAALQMVAVERLLAAVVGLMLLVRLAMALLLAAAVLGLCPISQAHGHITEVVGQGVDTY